MYACMYICTYIMPFSISLLILYITLYTIYVIQEILTGLGGYDFTYTPTATSRQPLTPVSPSPYREGKVRHSTDNRLAGDGQGTGQGGLTRQRRFSHSQITPFGDGASPLSPYPANTTSTNSGSGGSGGGQGGVAGQYTTHRVHELEDQVTALKEQNTLLYQQLQQTQLNSITSPRTLDNDFTNTNTYTTTNNNNNSNTYAYTPVQEGLYVGDLNLFATPIPPPQQTGIANKEQQGVGMDTIHTTMTDHTQRTLMEGLYVGQNNWFASPIPLPHSIISGSITPAGTGTGSGGQGQVYTLTTPIHTTSTAPTAPITTTNNNTINTYTTPLLPSVGGRKGQNYALKTPSTPIEQEVNILHNRLSELEYKVQSLYLITTTPTAPTTNTSNTNTNTITNTNNNIHSNETTPKTITKGHNSNPSQGSQITLQKSTLSLENIQNELLQIRKLKVQIDVITNKVEKQLLYMINSNGGTIPPPTSTTDTTTNATYTMNTTTNTRQPTILTTTNTTTNAPPIVLGVSVNPRTPGATTGTASVSTYNLPKPPQINRSEENFQPPNTNKPHLWPSSGSSGIHNPTKPTPTTTANTTSNTNYSIQRPFPTTTTAIHEEEDENTPNVTVESGIDKGKVAVNDAFEVFLGVLRSSQLTQDEVSYSNVYMSV